MTIVLGTFATLMWMWFIYVFIVRVVRESFRALRPLTFPTMVNGYTSDSDVSEADGTHASAKPLSIWGPDSAEMNTHEDTATAVTGAAALPIHSTNHSTNGTTSSPKDTIINPISTSNTKDATSNPSNTTSSTKDATSNTSNTTRSTKDATSNPSNTTSSTKDTTSNTSYTICTNDTAGTTDTTGATNTPDTPNTTNTKDTATNTSTTTKTNTVTPTKDTRDTTFIYDTTGTMTLADWYNNRKTRVSTANKTNPRGTWLLETARPTPFLESAYSSGKPLTTGDGTCGDMCPVGLAPCDPGVPDESPLPVSSLFSGWF